MPDYGKPQGMNAQAKADQAPKRRKEDEPDGPVSAAVQYLKNGFLPTSERIKADEEYEREQERKRRKQNEK